MPANVVIDMLADSSQPVKEFGAIEDSLQVIQRQAEQTSQATQQVVPMDELQQGTDMMMKYSQSYTIGATAMQSMGIYSGNLSRALRGLHYMQVSGATSALNLGGAVKGATVAVKSFLVAIGPVGWALIALTAAVKVGQMAWSRYSDAAEEAGRITEELTAIREERLADALDLEIRYLRAVGREKEAQSMEMQRSMNNELAALDAQVEQERELLEERQANYEGFWSRLVLIGRSGGEAREQHMQDTHRQLEELEESHQQQRARIEEVYRQKQMEEEENHLDVRRANAQAASEAWAQELRDITQALERENRELGKSSAELLRYRMEFEGVSEKRIEYIMGLKEQIESERELLTATERHTDNMKRMQLELEMYTAKLEDNAEALDDVMIRKRMLSGITREQAEAEHALAMETERAREAYIEQSQQVEEQADEQERLNRAQKEGLDQMYERIAQSAAVTREEDDIGTTGTGRSSASRQEERKERQEAKRQEDILERIYALLVETKQELPLIGAIG